MKSRKIAISILSLFLSFSLPAQTIGKKIKEIKAKDITQVSVDRLGNFFLVNKNGSIKKYDANGNLTASRKVKTVTLLEPWYHPAIFVYSQSNQTVSIFGRNFENEKTIPLESSWAIEPTLVAPSNDNKLWLFDRADASVKKVNQFSTEVLTEFNLDTAQFKIPPLFTYLREYQNMIFLLDRNSGIIILNNIGKQINKIEKADIKNFNFFGEELYYLNDSSIIFYDLASEETHQLKIGGENEFALVTDERIILVDKNNKVLLFDFKPN